MDLSTLFHIVNGVAIAGWLALVFLPRHPWTRQGLTVAVVSLLAATYVGLLLWFLGDADGNFGSLANVATLFSHPHVVLVGWIHYLAFDLFVGTWIVQDWAATGHPSWWMVPVLLATFWVGPVGLLTYLGIRAIVRRDLRVTVREQDSSVEQGSSST